MKKTQDKHIQEIDEGAARQYIDSSTVFIALQHAKKKAVELRGGMIWKTRNGTDYLIRTTTGSGQKNLGPRSEENEAIFREFHERKQQIGDRMSDLRKELDRHRKLNKVYQVGRAPELLVAVLNKHASFGMAEHLTVIGTDSLYAYIAGAGVRFDVDEALGPKEVDNLLNAKRKLREAKGDYTHLLNREEDFFIVRARNAGIPLDDKLYSTMIVSRTGRMAWMSTIAPATFIIFKRWLAGQDDRDPLCRARDIMQADLVEELIPEWLPHLQ